METTKRKKCVLSEALWILFWCTRTSKSAQQHVKYQFLCGWISNLVNLVLVQDKCSDVFLFRPIL